MPRSLSLTALQVNALTTSNDTILYNSQARDISLYGGTDIASTITQLEINNMSGDCLTLRFNGDANNYANFKMNSTGTFDVKINNGNKSFNIVNHNGSTFGLKLGGTLVTSTAAELNKLSGFTGTFANLDYLTGVTPGTATASKALVTDASNNLVGINDLSTQNLTVAGTLVTASATELNYTDIATAGTAQAAKALVVDVNKDIASIRNLTATSLSATNVTGTLQTASQPNITSVGTLGSLTVSGQINVGTLDANSILVDGVDITTAISGSDPTAGVTPGTVSASKVLLVDSSKNLTGMGNLTSTGTVTAATLAGALSTASQPNITALAGVTSVGASSATTLTGTLQSAAQSNVTSVGTLTSLTSNGNVNVASHDGSTQGLTLAGTLVTTTASEMNKLSGLTASTAELNAVAGVTPGTVSISKALVVDGNKDLTGIRNITTTGSITGAVGISATTLTGTLATASQPNITSVGTLSGLTVTNQINAGTLDAATILVNGVDIITSISGSDPTTGITPGTVSASKVLLVDSSKNLTGMGNLTSTGTITASTLTGTLSASAQTGISAVGTLTGLSANGNVDVAQHDGSTQGLKLAGTLVTAVASDLNKLTGVTNGTTSASKALVVDINKDLTGIRNLTSTGTVSATTLTGALSTASQSNVTAVGTLTGLTSNGDVDVAQHDGSTQGLKLQGTLVTATAADINKLSGVTGGTVSASKVVVVDTNQDLSGIRNLTTTGTISGVTTLTATTLAGALSTASQPNVTSVGTLTSLTSNGNVDVAQHNGTTTGFKLAGTLVTATAADLNKLASVTASAAELNTSAGVTAGTVTASKALVVDSNLDLSGIRNLTSTGTISGVSTLTATTVSATTLTGTLSAGAQNNITTLTGATSVGQNSSTILTGTLAAGTQPNVTTLDGVTSVGKSDNTTTLTGVLQSTSAAQPNITSVGTLTGLALSGGISGATTISSSGILSNTNTTDSTSNSTGAIVVSGGVGISKSTDATSSTNGGALTVAGGAAIEKKLYVGSDLTVGGNLTISGTTTTINSTTTTITDNTLLLNSGPAGTGYDAGVLTQRYQVDNSAGTGDIVSDTAKETYAIVSGTVSSITLPSGANATNSYYNNWWIKITSGTQLNQVRKITAYNGTTKVATLSTNLGGAPSASNNINLYNKSFTSLLWNESSKKFVSAFTSNDTTTPGALTIIDYADFTAKNITGTLATAAQPNVTSVGTLTGLTSSGNISTTGTGTITSAGLLTASAGLTVNGTLTLSSLSTSGNISTTGTGTITSAGLLIASAATNTQISDAGVATLVYPLSVSHLLSSGTPTANSFGIGMLFNGPNAINGIISYARIYSTCQSSTLNLHQGSLTLSTVFGGNFVDAVTISSSSATSSTLTINGTSSSLSLPGDSAKLTISNTTASTSSSTGVLQVAGGAYFGANSMFGGTISFSVRNTGKVSTTLPASCISLFDNPIYMRGKAGDDKNHFIGYCGNSEQTNWNTGKGFGNPATANDGVVICGNNSVIIGTLAGSATETICANFTSTGLGLGGGSPTCRLDLGLTASNMGINLYAGKFGLGAINGFLNYYGDTSHKWWNTQADVRLGVSQGTNTMTLNSTGDLAVSGSYLWTPSAGGVYGGLKFNVAGTGNATLQTFLGTADCGMGTTSAHPFGLITNGSYRMYISSAGNVGIGTLAPASALEVTGTARITSQSFPSTGQGFEMSYNPTGSPEVLNLGIANIYSFNRTAGTYQNINLNDQMYIRYNGYIGIGTTAPRYPLHVASIRASGDNSYNYYYYLGPGSTNSSTTAFPANISIKTDGRILVGGGEIDVVSDIRMKENIKCLDLNYCKSFVNIIKPVSFNYKTDTCDINYGYIAQEIIKNNFTELITVHSDDTMEEFIDNDGFKSEAGQLYSVSKNDIIPILHTVIKDQQTKITNLEQKNIDLESRLARLEAFISTLEITE